MTVALSGFMASGKSYFGKAAAEMLGLEFIDLDKEIEYRYGPISQLFSTVGEKGFRQLETETLKDVLYHTQNTILALGGGTPLNEGNRKILNLKATTVWLDTSWEIILSELGNNCRPLVQGKSEQETYALYLERKPLYEKYSDFSFKIDSFDYRKVAESLADFIRRVPSL